jgi:hypothetical protein
MQLTALLFAQTCCTWSRIWKLLMVRHGNRGKRAGKRKVRMSGSLSPKSVDRSICHNIPAEGTITPGNYAIYRTDDMYSGGSDTKRPQCFWIQMILPWNGITAVNNEGMIIKNNDSAPNDWGYVSKVSVNGASTILVWSVRQSKGCIITSIQRGIICRLAMQKACDILIAPS